MGSSTFAAAVIVVAAAVFYLAFSTAISWYRLSKFPGPFMNSISYLPMLQTRLRQSSPKYAALAGKYGPIVRIGPNDLLTSSPDHIRKMSAVRSTYGRSSWYKATRLDPYHDMMGSVLDKAGHHSLRTKMVAGYSGKDDPNLGACLDSQIAALIKRIQISYLSTPSTKVPVDFGKLADYYAHDARGRMSFGKPLGMLEKNADVHGIIATVKIALNLIQIFTDIPPLQKIFLSNFVLKLVGPKPTDNWGVGKLMGLAQDFVAQRFEPDAKDQQDLLGSFLRHGLDRRSAESEVMFPIIAGADTSASAIKTTVQLIVSRPKVYATFKGEIDAAAREGRISSPVTHEEATKLPYLQAVIWESLRICPPFLGLIMKEVGPDGDTVDGKFIPAGTRVGHNTWPVAHDKAVFGDDADEFRPERLLEADPIRRSAMLKQIELVFGYGRWGCPGRNVALVELHKILVELFRTFDFEPTPAEDSFRKRADAHKGPITIKPAVVQKAEIDTSLRLTTASTDRDA